jgi:hypothetical protein
VAIVRNRAWAENLRGAVRYEAAAAAAKAGCGPSKDADSLDSRARAGWRSQAVDWLRADLALHTRLLHSGHAADRELVRGTLTEWKRGLWLACVREPSALVKLPAEELKLWIGLWGEVESLLAQTRPAPD